MEGFRRSASWAESEPRMVNWLAAGERQVVFVTGDRG